MKDTPTLKDRAPEIDSLIGILNVGQRYLKGPLESFGKIFENDETCLHNISKGIGNIREFKAEQTLKQIITTGIYYRERDTF